MHKGVLNNSECMFETFFCTLLISVPFVHTPRFANSSFNESTAALICFRYLAFAGSSFVSVAMLEDTSLSRPSLMAFSCLPSPNTKVRSRLRGADALHRNGRQANREQWLCHLCLARGHEGLAHRIPRRHTQDTRHQDNRTGLVV